MSAVTTIVVIVLLAGWGIILVSTRVLFPYLVAAQLSSKDHRLARLLEKIPLVRINKRADSIEKLMKKPQNIRFMKVRYPVMYQWYGLSNRWSMRFLYLFGVFVLITQLVGVGKFVLDPEGERERIQSSLDDWRNQE